MKQASGFSAVQLPYFLSGLVPGHSREGAERTMETGAVGSDLGVPSCDPENTP